MFRYIGFAWSPSSEEQAALAERLTAALNAGQWTRAFSSSGLRVYAMGCKPGDHDIYSLPAGRGVVLGRLFRRGNAHGRGSRHIELTELEAERIVRSDGQALIDQFWGRWIAFLPSWTGESRVLRDPTGTLPGYTLQIDGVCVAFSWLEDVSQLLDLPAPAVNWDAVAASLVMGRLGAYETGLQGVAQILPGELTPMSVTDAGPLPLWRAVEIARRPVDLDHARAAQMLRDATTECVRGWMSCYDNIVLRLSGGVDSAILLGCLYSEAPTANIVCLNLYSPGSDSDERGYARLAAAGAGCRLIERHRDADFRMDLVASPALTPLPGNHIGRLGSDRIDAEVVNDHGASVMFTGAGGDQLFSESRGTWPAADYLQLRGIDRGFAAAVADAARLGRVSYWQSLKLAFRDRFARRDPLSGVGRYLTLVPEEVVDNIVQKAARFIHPGLLEATDLPIGKLMQLRSLSCPFEYYNPYAPATSPELVHPLMSQPLLELSLQLPTYVLTRGGYGRALARAAFADRIPAEIASRRSKGGTEQHAASVLNQSLPLVRNLLLDGELVRRGLLDRQRVESTLAGRPSTNGAYVTEVHSCFAVEAWLTRVIRGATVATS
ncbi:asparagine synthase-related protein [Roseateles sp. LYH14W]|uniref:Asparagine synthase-related protein n=1 Tax=Pelomonas parva TaxID=3299032 RepID=A0ABW7FAQ5_9BURK